MIIKPKTVFHYWKVSKAMITNEFSTLKPLTWPWMAHQGGKGGYVGSSTLQKTKETLSPSPFDLASLYRKEKKQINKPKSSTLQKKTGSPPFNKLLSLLYLPTKGSLFFSLHSRNCKPSPTKPDFASSFPHPLCQKKVTTFAWPFIAVILGAWQYCVWHLSWKHSWVGKSVGKWVSLACMRKGHHWSSSW